MGVFRLSPEKGFHPESLKKILKILLILSKKQD